ncbi:ankyrin [Wilcoxina mikolae CBS 423.85]|nr:ankyrin [Wilcoxina mikolae CBS 423.85]
MPEILPLNDASTFFLQVLNTLTDGNEERNMVPYKGGLIKNAEGGSPIVRRLLREYLPEVCQSVEDRAWYDTLEEKHEDLLDIPLHASQELKAVIERNPDICWSTLKYEFPGLNMVAFGGDTYLHIAAQHGYTMVVQHLVDEIPDVDFVNLQNYHHETPLFKAAKGGHLNICKILLEAGAEVKENLFNETPLHWVSAFSKADDIGFLVREFVARGGDIARYAGRILALTMDTHAKAGTPLERAVSRNNPVAVKVILEVGDNPDLLVTEKALHTAATYHF